MKRRCLLSLSILILVVSMFAPVTAVSQPPVITDTLYIGQVGWGPRRADPVRAYDTASGELLMNVYDTLIAMNWEMYWEFVPLLATNVPAREDITKDVSSTDVNLSDPTGSNWSDSLRCVGWVDNHATGNLDTSDVLYMVEADGSYRTWLVQSFNVGPPVTVTLWMGRYTFHMRTSPVINFVNETGAIVDAFDVYDAEYSLKRGLVQDQTGSPMWMFYKPLFDQMNSNFSASNTTEPTAMTLAHLIDNAIEVSGNDLAINVGIPFPDAAFKQNLAQTWGSIVSKEFSISIGCWNGDLYADSNGDGYPDWWTQWRRISCSPYDTTEAYRYVGTGPYRVTVFDKTNNIVKLTRNANYWRGWPAPGVKSYLETVEIRYIVSWDKRAQDFLACNLDICAVPRAYMSQLLDVNREPLFPEIKTIKNLASVQILDGLFFTFTINGTSAFIGNGAFPNGVPTTFFNNTNVRRAFAYAFNHTRYVKDVYFEEAMWPSTSLISGLYPDYRTDVSGYDANFDLAEAELKNAIFNGKSVWETGFSFSMGSFSGGEGDYIWPNLHNFFAALSTYDHRPPEWPDFVINITYLDWTDYLNKWEHFELPFTCLGWMGSFTDADDFIRPFMHSKGDYSSYQNYTANNGWGSRKDELIDLAIKTPDGSSRAAMYAELQQIYINDCPNVMIAQPLLRKWMKYWVRGWYYNPLYPGDYYYSIWKEDTCWFDISGQTLGVSDDVVNIFDINWLVQHFNAKAPGSGVVDPKWVGIYGCGGVDPSGDRICNIIDINGAVRHFLHKQKP